ncbi:uncharacterized protein L3040_000251 [Drepanopeziza brunnea f. sp. 'multigermtubi']|uniref:uncharacterized protein n=1 Tax=Drepanopeziza brunnea f. sp. 'multigermtubi' TaxID=698441 RepID=UPI00239724A4|nr:hypothetical protein L3040_000251 [Drepanopeziza brunnea f. sp. 'multigermtubi']
MQFSTLAVSLAFIASATAVTLSGFPNPFTCGTFNGTQTWTEDELKALVVGVDKSTPFEESAANIASGRCVRMRLPYYLVGLGKGASTLGFAYDEANELYEYCFAQTVDLNGDRWPDAC